MEAPLALYRRYRPETFSEVIGQDHVTDPLRNALTNNRVNHAYLFSGPRGCGKTTSARILARAINCEKGPIAEPCGECRSCRDLARGGPGSIDVIEIDAASHGGVDDARDLRERAFFSPVQSRYKIYIIDEAHMVTTQGFNALLKLVEEPPPHLKFIFATTEPDKVIGTIRSRTHHYPFRLVPPKVLADYMAQLCAAENIAIEQAALPLVVRAGAGSVRDSLSVLDQLIGGAGPDGVTYQLAVALLGFTPDSLLDACMDGFAAHDSAAVFEVIDKVIETGQDPKRFAEDLLRRLRDLVILSAVPSAVASGLIDVAEDQGERLQTQAAGLGAAELTRAADIVAAGLLEMRGATAPRLQLELICAKVLLPGADDSTNGIQARLDRIERRISLGLGAGSDAAQPVTEGPPPDQAASRAAARLAAQPGTASADTAPGVASTTGGTPSGGAASGGTPSGGATPGGAAGGVAGDAAGGPAGDGVVGAGGSPDVTQPDPSAQPSAGGIGLADVRRLWPDILQRVKERKKVSWMMLSQNAQVLAIDDKTLTIGLSHAGVRENFVRSGHDEILREAVRDAIMLDRRIEAVVDPSTDPTGASSPSPSASSASHGGSTAPATASGHSGSSAPAGAPGASDPAASAAGGSSTSAASPPAGLAPTDTSGQAPAQATTGQPTSRVPNPAGAPSRTGSWNEPPATPSPHGGASGATSDAAARGGRAAGHAGPARNGDADDPASPAGPAQSAGSGGQAAPGGHAGSTTAAPADTAEQRREQATNKRRAAEAAYAAEQVQRAQAAGTAPEQPLSPEEEAEVIGEDDLVLEEDSRSHTDLLRETLGAQVIDEQPN